LGKIGLHLIFFQTTRTLYRQTTYRLLFFDRGNKRYMIDMSSSVTADPNMLSNCFLKLEKWCPKLEYPCLLIDSHPHSPLKDYPVRANFLPQPDGHIQQILFETDKK